MAATIGDTVSVRLHRPPPLECDLDLQRVDDNQWQLRQGEVQFATAKPTRVPAQHVPAPVDYVAALAASRNYYGHIEHPYPTCFVCGPQRARGDGLRIFAGRVREPPVAQQHNHVLTNDIVAAPWMPHESLSDGDGKVRPEFMWAALDCPGYFASMQLGAMRPALLGELAVQIERRVHIDEPCVIVGWRILIEGRKHKVGTAMFDEDGERCAVGVATWLEVTA